MSKVIVENYRSFI